MATPRKVTNKLFELMEEGVLDPQLVAEACLRYMSEADVADMARSEELINEPEEDEDDE